MSYAMSNTGKALVGAFALTLGALGAAQFAFGHDLSESIQSFASVTDNSVAVTDYSVNRGGKSDRSPRIMTSASPTQTIAVQLNGLTETTVVMRIPLTPHTDNSASVPLLTTYGPQKRTVACEAMVSVLTDVAKQLPPGRCVT